MTNDHFNQDDIPMHDDEPRDSHGPLDYDADGVVTDNAPTPPNDALSEQESLLISLLERVHKGSTRDDIDEVLDAVKANSVALHDKIADKIAQPVFVAALQDQIQLLSKAVHDSTSTADTEKQMVDMLAELRDGVARLERGQGKRHNGPQGKRARQMVAAGFVLLIAMTAYGTGYAITRQPVPWLWFNGSVYSNENRAMLERCVVQAQSSQTALRCPIIIRP